MRTSRTIIATLLSTLLGLGVFAATPAQAETSLPKRTIVEQSPDDHQVSFNAFKLKGTVTELQADGVTALPYAKKKVQLQKKVCAKGCKWKTVQKLKTNEAGKYKTKIFAPRNGRWKWRVKVKSSNGFRTTKGQVWTLLFQ